jgi:chromosome segregation ATPase
MRLFFISFALALVVLGTMISCKDIKEEEPDSSSSATQGKKAHPAIDLVRRKVGLEKQLESIIAKADLSGQTQIKEAEAKAREADQHFLAVQNQHPQLQKLLKKAARLRGRYSPTNSAQNAKTTAMMQEINTEIFKISSTLPELQAARNAQAQARKAIHNTRRQLADKIPQAKAILEELSEIDTKLAAQRPQS